MSVRARRIVGAIIVLLAMIAIPSVKFDADLAILLISLIAFIGIGMAFFQEAQ